MVTLRANSSSSTDIKWQRTWHLFEESTSDSEIGESRQRAFGYTGAHFTTGNGNVMREG